MAAGHTPVDLPEGLRINEPWVVVTGVVVSVVALYWLFRDFQASLSVDFLSFAANNVFAAPQWPLILVGLFSPFALARVQSRVRSNYVDIMGYVIGIYCGGRFLLETLNLRAADLDFVQFMMTLTLAASFAVGVSGIFAGLAQFTDRKRREAGDTRYVRNAGAERGPDTVESAGSSSDYFEFDPRVFLYGDDFLSGGEACAAHGARGSRFMDDGADPAPTCRGSSRPQTEPLKALPHYRRPGTYTTAEALRMFDVAGIQGLPPSSTNGAVSLASAYILSVGWIRAREFIHGAARDEELPKRVRDFYIHALVVLDQLRREAELHNMDDLHPV